METSYKLLWKSKYQELLRDAERERLAKSLHARRLSSVGQVSWSLIAAAAVLVVLLRVA